MEENFKQQIRSFIRDEFTEQLRPMCNMKSRVCRGGSRELYKLLMKSSSTPQYMSIDNLQIVSGLGHTFIRYNDTKFNRYLYIDPTLAQFDPTFEGIFIGDEMDLRNIVNKQEKTKGYKLDIADYIGSKNTPPLTVEKNLLANALKGGRKSRTLKKQKGGVPCVPKNGHSPLLPDGEIPAGWGKCTSPTGLPAIGLRIVWKSFMDGAPGPGIWTFMTTVATKLHGMNHHPEWFNSYTTLIIILTTHDSCGISILDRDSANYINELLETMKARVKEVGPYTSVLSL